jgi:energy-coupling factor transporter ATP-binding protein EcfA2
MTNENSVISIPVLNWFDKPMKTAINSVFDDINSSVEALDIFKKYKTNHFTRLQHRIKHIKILGMSEPIDLTDVYSPAMVSTTIFGRLYEQEWLNAREPDDFEAAKSKRRRKEVRGDKYIENNDRVVILGPAGSGKTTFLKHLALSYCDQGVFSTTELETTKFPFFVSLLSYARGSTKHKTIKSYVVNELEEYTDKYALNFVERVAKKGLAILILDSLDEVPLSRREIVIDDIQDFCNGFPLCKVVISCRTADYREAFDDFCEVELTKHTDQAIRRIITAWFKSEPPRGSELIRHISRDKGVKALCGTPLLLSLICIQFKHDLALPKRKAELYRRCIDAFLREWDASRGFRRETAYSRLSDDRKEKLFEAVAGKFFTPDTRYTFPENELVGFIGSYCERFEVNKKEARGVLKEIEAHHGVLERISADSFSFSHPSLQEYFVARYLISHRMEMNALKVNILSPHWANVIEFIIAQHSDPAALLTFIADKSDISGIRNYPPLARRTESIWLLYRCLAAGAAIPIALRRELYERIVDFHFHMGETFNYGGVFPVPVLVEDGIRHSYLFFRKRKTLHQALRPLRLLANEILLTPSEEYAKQAVKKFHSAVKPLKSSDELVATSVALCLAVPLAKSRPKEVRKVLDNAMNVREGLFGRMVKETLSEMDKQGLK